MRIESYSSSLAKREKKGPVAKQRGDEGTLTSIPSPIPLLRNGPLSSPAGGRGRVQLKDL